MRRLRLVLEYDGTDFCGFQRQPGRRTVQGALEERLSSLLGGPVDLTAAGRTDAGVHATGQVVHFDTEGQIPADRLEEALQYKTEPELRIRRVEETDVSFHARFGAVGRTYRYYMSVERPSPFVGRYATWTGRMMADAVTRMQVALPAIIGTHDFGAFCAAGAEVPSTVRTVKHAAITELGPVIRLEISADAFLWRMVRSIAGELIEIGRGRREPDRLEQALRGQSRTSKSISAPPRGLFLVRVEYPDGYGADEPLRDPLTDWQILSSVR